MTTDRNVTQVDAHHSSSVGRYFEGYLEVAGKHIALISVITLCVSVLYDWGYFEALNLSFRDLPTGIADHVRSALLWSPAAVGAALIYTLTDLLIKSFGVNNASNSPSLHTWFGRGIIGVALLTVGCGFFLSDFLSPVMMIAVPIVFLHMASTSFPRNAFYRSLTEGGRLLYLALPCLALFFYFYGRAAGVLDVYKDPHTKVVVQGLEGPVEVGLLRHLDKGALVKDAHGSVIFYRWENVIMTSAPLPQKGKGNRLCTWFSLGCSWTPI